MLFFLFFFFQAEDGIRDGRVTGVQTCALPICLIARQPERCVVASRRTGDAPSGYTSRDGPSDVSRAVADDEVLQIGRASCRERVFFAEVPVSLKTKSSSFDS